METLVIILGFVVIGMVLLPMLLLRGQFKKRPKPGRADQASQTGIDPVTLVLAATMADGRSGKPDHHDGGSDASGSDGGGGGGGGE